MSYNIKARPVYKVIRSNQNEGMKSLRLACSPGLGATEAAMTLGSHDLRIGHMTGDADDNWRNSIKEQFYQGQKRLVTTSTPGQ